MTASNHDGAPPGREQGSFESSLINRLAREFLEEQRRSRRWGIFFKLLLAAYVLLFLMIWAAGRWEMADTGFSGSKHTALVDVDGIIAADTESSADMIVSGLRAAFEDRDTAGVILRINSPGGSPVQAGYVYDEIKRLRAKHADIPLYAVISDLCASGGYYIASAADEIYADKASIVGSIGVIMAGFGFVDAIEKLGIERRVRNAGDHKALMDPFAPLDPEEVAHVDSLLEEIHEQFIEVVEEGRGDRLSDDEQIYSGLIWTGEQSIELGLVDGLGSAGFVARDIVGQEEIVDFTRRRPLLERFASSLGSAVADRLRFNGGVTLR